MRYGASMRDTHEGRVLHMVRKETAQLVNAIRKGTHSEDVNLFCRSAVDFVERKVGPSEDVAAVRDALRQHA